MNNATSPKKLIKNLKDLEKTIEILKKHSVAEIKIEGIEITIPKNTPTAPAPKPDLRSEREIEDEILFGKGMQ